MPKASHEPPALHRYLRRWHERARSIRALHWVVILARLALAIAFVPQALLKMRGIPFTTMSTDTTIGLFFDAMYRTGMYWRFIGASQIVASTLLVLPWTTTLGALLFLPIILNIFIVTSSLHFALLPVVSGAMLVAVILLLAWDYHRLASILWGPHAAYDVQETPWTLHDWGRTVQAAFQRWHATARSLAPLHRLALISRILLALAFVPTSLVKVMGHRFTTLSTATPIGYFFEAMYQSGLFWRFLGASQLLAGAMLLLPTTSTLGAALFFPIVLNIFVITVSLHFTGTPVITGLMLLASTFLLCWDYHRLASVLWGPRAAYDAAPGPFFPKVERVGYTVGTFGALIVLFLSRGLVGHGTIRLPALVGVCCAALGGLFVAAGWVQVGRTRAPVPE